MVALFEGFDEFVAGDVVHVGETAEANLWKGEDVFVLQQCAQMGGIPEDAGRVGLSHHLGEGVAYDLEAVAAHVVVAEGWAFVVTHGRQLGRVAQQDEPAASASIDEVDEVVEQSACTVETAGEVFVVGYHGGLVADEEEVLPHVVVEGEDGVLVDGLLAVDALVDGEGRMVGIEGEHLGCTTRGSQQHTLALQLLHRLDQGTDEGGLARAGKAS